MVLSKAMNNYKDLPRCLMDYVRGAYKRALEKDEATLPFSLLKAAVDRARKALNGVGSANTIQVRPQQDAPSGSKLTDVVESRSTEQGQGGRKSAKGKGKGKEDPVMHERDERQANTEDSRAGLDTRAKRGTEKRAGGSGTKASQARAGTNGGWSHKNDQPVPRAMKGTISKVPYVLI